MSPVQYALGTLCPNSTMPRDYYALGIICAQDHYAPGNTMPQVPHAPPYYYAPGTSCSEIIIPPIKYPVINMPPVFRALESVRT